MTDEDKKPYEVKQMEALKSSTWRQMVIEKLRDRIKEQQEQLNEKEPSWLTSEEKMQRYEWLVRAKDLIAEVQQFELIPDMIIQEYSNENFTLKMS